MPLPKPKPKESQEQFIDRCMGNAVMVREFDDTGRRRAVCQAQWANRKKEAKAASVPTEFWICGEATGLNIEAAGDEGDGKTLRRFTMTAYTGGEMVLAGWPYPVVVDLKGLKIPKQSRPILKDHNRSLIVGHTDKITKTETTLEVTGVISGAGRVAQEVVQSSENGFPWQASVGARAEKVVFVPEGKTARANGREFTGPIYIARRATLGEMSFVALGADEDTSARVAAQAARQNTEVFAMNFEQWVEAQGFTLADLSEKQAENLKATYEAIEASQAGGEGDDGGEEPSPADPDGSDEPQVTQAAPSAVEAKAAVENLRAELAAETKRVATIRKTCAGKHPEIEAKAIEEGWDETKTELEVLRASRPKAPAAHVPEAGVNGTVLEAACMLTAGLSDVENLYEDPTLDAASKRFRGGIGLQELLLEAAWANGYTGRSFRASREVLRFAFAQNLSAAFSTIDIGGILSNVANKFLLEGFFSVERVWRNICAVRNVSDFKTVTSYRLIGKDQYEPVAPGGELKHGTLGEEQYANKADTYGLLLSVDRRDVINDDLGAITTVPRKLGRGSGLKINDVFWTIFLDNSGFFKTANKNYLTGTDTVLSIDGLTKAEVAFLDQVDSDGKPIGIMPQIVLVPTALSAMGTQLYKSLELRDTTASTKYPVANPHQGKFRVEVSRYLANTHYTGASAKAWYLLADAADLPVIEVAFLNGQESPTIETAEADFNVLGVQMRGYHDFGCALQDPKGGTKNKGEA